jgi:hypothetical protein
MNLKAEIEIVCAELRDAFPDPFCGNYPWYAFIKPAVNATYGPDSPEAKDIRLKQFPVIPGCSHDDHNCWAYRPTSNWPGVNHVLDDIFAKADQYRREYRDAE